MTVFIQNLRFFARRSASGGSRVNPVHVHYAADFIEEALAIADMARPSQQVEALDRWARKVREHHGNQEQ